MKKITRATCKLMRDEINLALADLGKRYELKIHAGNASYTDNSVTFKVECLLEGFDKAKDQFEECAHLFDLTKDDYGRDFNFRGRTFKLVGLKPRSPKFPIIGFRAGKRWKLPEGALESLLS